MGEVWFLSLGANTWRARERQPTAVIFGWCPQRDPDEGLQDTQ